MPTNVNIRFVVIHRKTPQIYKLSLNIPFFIILLNETKFPSFGSSNKNEY